MDLSFLDDIINDIDFEAQYILPDFEHTGDSDSEAQHILPIFEHINFNYDFNFDVMSTLHTQ